MKHKWIQLAAGLALSVGVAGCKTEHTVRVEHDVKPIHLTVDINIKVDRELDDFFAFEEELSTATPSSESAATPMGADTP